MRGGELCPLSDWCAVTQGAEEIQHFVTPAADGGAEPGLPVAGWQPGTPALPGKCAARFSRALCITKQHLWFIFFVWLWVFFFECGRACTTRLGDVSHAAWSCGAGWLPEPHACAEFRQGWAVCQPHLRQVPASHGAQTLFPTSASPAVIFIVAFVGKTCFFFLCFGEVCSERSDTSVPRVALNASISLDVISKWGHGGSSTQVQFGVIWHERWCRNAQCIIMGDAGVRWVQRWYQSETGPWCWSEMCPVVILEWDGSWGDAWESIWFQSAFCVKEEQTIWNITGDIKANVQWYHLFLFYIQTVW